MSTKLNKDGQPLNSRFNASQRADRDVSEMLGLVKGVLADGKVTSDEAVMLDNWVLSHPDVTSTWPGNILLERLQRIFQDGKISKSEQLDLLELLNDLVGGKAGIIGGENTATTLPLDSPPPVIHFNKSIFVVTGKFAFGPRDVCIKSIEELGGACESAITKRTNYLVIGTFASRDWIQTSHGRKIEKAIEYKKSGVPIAIIGEDHWAKSFSK